MSVAIGRIAGIVMAPASSGARSALHAKGLAGAISATGGDIELSGYFSGFLPAPRFPPGQAAAGKGGLEKTFGRCRNGRWPHDPLWPAYAGGCHNNEPTGPTGTAP